MRKTANVRNEIDSKAPSADGKSIPLPCSIHPPPPPNVLLLLCFFFFFVFDWVFHKLLILWLMVSSKLSRNWLSILIFSLIFLAVRVAKLSWMFFRNLRKLEKLRWLCTFAFMFIISTIRFCGFCGTFRIGDLRGAFVVVVVVDDDAGSSYS